MIHEPQRVEAELPVWRDLEDLRPTLDRIRPFTMVPEDWLVDLARQVRAVLTQGIPGHLVECGVWRGGAAFLMADLLRQAGVRDRKVWLLDSFEGLPPPEEIDGPHARRYARDTASRWYFDNCRASLEEVRRTAEDLGLAPYTEFVKGWFDQTLPTARERIGPIALLRIDADWYQSVRCCLEHLYDSVVDGGIVTLDDYYTYDGCAAAVHEFLGRRCLAHRIETVPAASASCAYNTVALFCKGATTWQTLQRLDQATLDVTSVVPRGETFILVDQGHLERFVTPGRRRVPFPEHEGQYWGPPPDDAAAIRELERLQQAGASFVVVAWPAFWWLDYYAGFHRHLRARARGVLESDCLVIFDLRARPS
ncbi:MAG TPA: TylF/MycF/NovP-related O-methyltransferase [Thermodesulfobacteriota bacterium]